MVHLMRQSPVGFPVPPKRPVMVKINDAKRSCKACNAKGRSCFRMKPGAKNIGYGKGPVQNKGGQTGKQGGF